MPLLVFVGFQLAQTTCMLLLDREGYIHDQLNDSWQRAYDSNSEHALLEQLQTRLQCQGFADPLDRSLPTTSDATMEACFGKLTATFGQAIYAWGIALWILKMVQMAGLVGCYGIYLRMDQQVDDIEEGVREHEKAGVLRLHNES
ncbi:hypothetical protein BJV82DRAFT_583396 [Fennellomyces sp. T-0311]|nr:hypothetical protein BJV82DRAFT_583396 [Fennellomyces sp. T-0311]